MNIYNYLIFLKGIFVSLDKIWNELKTYTHARGSLQNQSFTIFTICIKIDTHITLDLEVTSICPRMNILCYVLGSKHQAI